MNENTTSAQGEESICGTSAVMRGPTNIGSGLTAPPPASRDVWRQHARQWQQVGAPLRPTPEDGRLLFELAQPALAATPSEPRVVVMGVTPEVVQLPWPSQVRLLAVDQSADMIASVWQPHAEVRSSARQARWQAMPVDDAAVDVLAGDASLNALASRDEYQEVLPEVVRVLKPTGRLVLRCFIRPERTEAPDAVRAATLAGEVGGFHALKWRVAMALAAQEDFSVAVADIRAAFDELFPDRDLLALRTGWTRATIDTIDAYRGATTRLTFPTMSTLTRVVAPWLEVVEQRQPTSYELSQRCPTVAFGVRRPG